MWSWIYDVNSIVSFLAFCFALNTMLSFTKVRHRLLGHLQKGLHDVLEENQVPIKDCEATLRKCPEKINGIAKKCFQLKNYFAEVENLNKKYKERFDSLSKLFQGFFFIFALISGILLVFSKCPYLLEFYKYTILLLLPVVVFYIISLYYWITIFFVIRSKKKEIHSYAEKVNNVKEMLREVNNYISQNSTK